MDPLNQLTRRIRWKRHLQRALRMTWVLAGLFLLLFLADQALEFQTLGLRILSAALATLAGSMLLADGIVAWRVRLDRVGLAQVLEKHHPDLAERLITLVQLEGSGANPEFVSLLQSETAAQLALIEPADACPLRRERNRWGLTLLALAAVFLGLAFVPAFAAFNQRFFLAWVAPLKPFQIEVAHGGGHALRGDTLTIEAEIHPQDERAVMPTECVLICEDAAGTITKMPMAPSGTKFVAHVENAQESMRCRVEAGRCASESFTIDLIDAPVLVGRPSIVVTPPAYLNRRPETRPLDGLAESTPILQYSKADVHFSVDRRPVRALVQVTSLDGKTSEPPVVAAWQDRAAAGVAEAIARVPGIYEATLVLELEHGLVTRIVLGQWTVHADHPPAFTQMLRLRGGAGVLQAGQEYRIAPGDRLRLQTAVEDREGLDSLAIEYRINDDEVKLVPWMTLKGQREMTIEEWLPLPGSLKTSDRVQFRVQVQDGRRLRRGEVRQTPTESTPEHDLAPQVVVSPSVESGGGWITLHVDAAVDGFVKQQTTTQAAEVRDIVNAIKKKLQAESAQIQDLLRAVHRQPAIQPAQAKQAEKTHKLNQEIMGDLNQAGAGLLTNPDLASLAAHFFDIAEAEMQQSDDALTRFRDKNRPLPDAEKELPVALDALARALKKLERLLDWNQAMAQDRLDQWQIEVLEKRQRELADRLQKLENQPLDDAARAKEMEAIRQEQAKLEAETAGLQKQNKLVKESLAALEQMRMQRLSQAAEQLAAEQQKLRELDPNTMPAAIKERLLKLAERQADLGKRVEPFSKKNSGPTLDPAGQAAVALRKPRLEEAIDRQKEHEKRLRDWLDQMLPGAVANKLRDDALRLAKAQQAIRAELEKLAQDLGNLNQQMIDDRLRDILKKQKSLNADVAKLPVNPKDAKQGALHKEAEKTTAAAADHLSRKDALEAFESMEKARLQLQALADAMPKALPVDRKDIKDPAQRARADQIDHFSGEQKLLREETERLLADWMKASGQGKSPLEGETAKLEKDLLELSQNATSPEAKAMAKESAQAINDAKKAMEASQAMKAKGDAGESKKMEDEAGKKLELAVKQLAKLTQNQDPKNKPNMDAEKTAEAIQESSAKMRQAEADLPKMPKDARAAMEAAAQKLSEASSQARKLSAKNVPSPPARNPAAKANVGPKGRLPNTNLKQLPLDGAAGKIWGELPGELKTQMLQDFRARFGEDYSEMIRQYFERVAETPAPARKD